MSTNSAVDAAEYKPLDGIKALLCSPTYGPVDPGCSKALRVAMMHSSNYGVKWVGDVSPDRMAWATSRNMAAQHLLKEGPGFANGIMWVDSDIMMKPDDISRLLGGAKHFGYDFVSGIYYQRLPAHSPVFYHYNKKTKRFSPADEFPEGVIAPTDGCGFGFVWTSWNAVDKIARSKEFDPYEGWFPDKRQVGGFGEDLSFCYLAMKAGVQLYADTSIQVGHAGGPYVVTRADFLREREKLTEKDKTRVTMYGLEAKDED